MGGSGGNYSPIKYYRSITIYGRRNDVTACWDAFREKYSSVSFPQVTWWYKVDGRLDNRSLTLDDPQEIHDEFYPFLGSGVDSFIDSYMNSSSSVLFLMGPPGTGKTSLLRHMIHRTKINTHITYDESIMGSDVMFANFMGSTDPAMIIFEDADVMLTSRESSANPLMNRFLNVSDGILKFKNKKLVFTTNLGDHTLVDQALLRPGRCFATVRFRHLTGQEQEAARAVAGLPEHPQTKQDVTLAQLFNGVGNYPPVRRVGFGN
jgi:hypothetical protein